MEEEKRQQLDYGIHSNVVIDMLDEFLQALNVPQTQTMFQKQITKMKHYNSPVEQQMIQQAQQMGDGEQKMSQPKQQEKQCIGLHIGRGEKEGQMDQQKSEQDGQQDQNVVKKQIKPNTVLAVEMQGFFRKGFTFCEIINRLQNKSKRNAADNQNMIDEKNEKNIQNLLKNPNSTPKIAQIFSAFQSVKEMRKIHLPIHHTMSIEPKTQKKIKYIGISPKQHFLVTVDMESSLFIYNTQSKKLVHRQKKQSSGQSITCLKWLWGDLLAVGKSNGTSEFSIVCLDLKILASVKEAHQGPILDIFEYQGFLYSIGSDNKMAKISKRKWKVVQQFDISISAPSNKYTFTDPPCKVTKIKDQRLKNACFLMDRNQGRVWMFDQMSGLEKQIFNIKKHCRNGVITNMVSHQMSKSLILGVSQKNKPQIYQILPLTNQIILRISGTDIVNQIIEENSIRQSASKGKQKIHHINFSYFHGGEVLAYASTLDEGKIKYISLRNWRNLHSQNCQNEKDEENKQSKVIICGGMVATGGDEGVQEESQLIFQVDMGKKKSNQDKTSETHNGNKKQDTQLRHQIVVLVNKTSGHLEVYDTNKSSFTVIKSEHQGLRRMLALGPNLPRGAEGFLTLIQNIRENYNVFF